MFQLNFFEEDGTPIRQVILKKPVTVGQDAGNVVSLSSPHISGRHATFLIVSAEGQSQVMLRDEGSINSCVVNGQTVKSETVPIHVGDEVLLNRFRVELTETRELDLSLENEKTRPRSNARSRGICGP